MKINIGLERGEESEKDTRERTKRKELGILHSNILGSFICVQLMPLISNECYWQHTIFNEKNVIY